MSPLIGRLMDRAGPRAVMELGVLLMGGGLLLAPLTSQPWHLYLTIGVMVGAGSVCLGYSGQSLFLPNWFVRRRGLAMGLAFAGVGIGSMTLLPWVQHMIEQTGWRTACTAMGIMVLVVLGADQSVAAQEARGHRPAARRRCRAARDRGEAGVQHRRSRLGRDRLDVAARACAPRGSGGSRSAISAGCTSGTRCRCTRPNSCSTSASAPNVAVWALGTVSLLGIPGQIVLGHVSDRIGREGGVGDQLLGLCDLLRGADRAEIRCRACGWSISWCSTQGALGYGLTSVMGAVVLEIFQGRHYGSIFGSIMLAALAGGAAGPWVDRAAVRSSPATTPSPLPSASR